jgi:pilus assembly protein CpaF
VSRPGWLPITIRDLLRASCGSAPDRIVVGEVRGGETFDFFQALNTGHSGRSRRFTRTRPSRTLDRFTSCVLHTDLSHPAIRHSHRECLHLAGASGALGRPSHGDAPGGRAPERRADR